MSMSHADHKVGHLSTAISHASFFFVDVTNNQQSCCQNWVVSMNEILFLILSMKRWVNLNEMKWDRRLIIITSWSKFSMKKKISTRQISFSLTLRYRNHCKKIPNSNWKCMLTSNDRVKQRFCVYTFIWTSSAVHKITCWNWTFCLTEFGSKNIANSVRTQLTNTNIEPIRSESISINLKIWMRICIEFKH